MCIYVIPRKNCPCFDVGICWKAPLRQWRFREIATSAEVHGFLAILAKGALVSPKAGEGIYARAFAAKTAARLRTKNTLQYKSDNAL